MESSRIADQLRRSIHGEAWHGPSVMELLNGVDVEQAGAKPVAGAHSIRELILHISAWAEVAVRRIQGEIVELDPAEDFPAVTGATEESWKADVRSLLKKQEALASIAAALSDQRLEEITPGKDYSLYFLLHGVAQHNLYHAGQIALLKKR
ncbi:MAG: DinB family protein [Bryobacteraceae bacterium]